VLPQLSGVFSIISEYEGASEVETLSLESLTGVRADLDVFDIDDNSFPEATATYREAVERSIDGASALVTYRSSDLVSSVCFSKKDSCTYLGMFNAHQAAFEHKPWVETSLAKLGVATLNWEYVDLHDAQKLRALLDGGPLMARRSRTTGGVGFSRIDTLVDALSWEGEGSSYTSVARYSSGSPVNIGGVVWDDGVSVHPASLQLIGVACLTERAFGYCGNDFGAMSMFEAKTLDDLKHYMNIIGTWLHSNGYRGAFGADFLVEDGRATFLEVNPRFQGSTRASCQLSGERGEAGIIMEHLGALLGMACPGSASLRDYVGSGPLAQFVVHAPFDWLRAEQVASLMTDVRTAGGRVDTALTGVVLADRGAAVARVVVRDVISTSGFELGETWENIVSTWATAIAQ